MSTPEDSGLPTKLVFEHKYVPEHREWQVDGVLGHVNQREMLRATFFTEYKEILECTEHPLLRSEPDTLSLGPEVPIETDTLRMRRDMCVTLSFNRKSLADLIPWLQTRLEELIAMESGRRKEESEAVQ